MRRKKFLDGLLLLLVMAAYTVAPGTNPTQAGEAMSDDIAVLTAFNQSYLNSYRNGLVEFFEERLVADFKETAPDGTVLNKEEFLQKIAAAHNSGEQLKIEAGELDIQLFGDTAIVRSIPLITNPDGSSFRGGRYTDVYTRIDGEWFCVAAHLGGTPN